MRQGDPEVRGYAVTHPEGVVRLPTQPGWVQIIYAKFGVLVARTDREAWTVPPHRALWVSDGIRVQLTTRRRTAVRCLYLRSHLVEPSVESVRVITIASVTRELLLHAVDRCPLDLTATVDAALVTLLVDQLSSHPTTALRLPLPVDSRAARLADIVIALPGLTLRAAIPEVGASRRTLERLFLAETAMTLAAWQRRARVLAAIDLMEGGLSVTTTAVTVGYSTPSSFVAAFRSELGETPRAFMATRVR